MQVSREQSAVARPWVRRVGVALLSLVLLAPWEAELAKADHNAPGPTCGISSGNFARTCSSSALAGCRRAAQRGVAGFTQQSCRRKGEVCSICIAALHTCIGKMGHPEGVNLSCTRCTERFDRCMDRKHVKRRGA